jgi:hypothetical protein
MTYAELLQKIRDYTEVDANVLTDTICNGFIQDAEWRIARDVDADYDRQYATSNVVPGQRFLNMPDPYLIIRSIQIINAGTRTFIQPRDTSFFGEYNPTDAQGEPKYYGNWYEDVVVFAPVPDIAYQIQVNYILSPVQLSVSNTTTYISEYFPNGLLYACLVEAFGFLKGPVDMLQLYDKKYQEAAKGFAIEQMGRRRRDEYQAGVPRIGKQ